MLQIKKLVYFFNPYNKKIFPLFLAVFCFHKLIQGLLNRCYYLKVRGLSLQTIVVI